MCHFANTFDLIDNLTINIRACQTLPHLPYSAILKIVMHGGSYRKTINLTPLLSFVALLCFLTALPSIASAQTATTTQLTATSTAFEIITDPIPAKQLFTYSFVLKEGQATTTDAGIGIDIPLPKTATPTSLLIHTKELGHLELPPIAWASTTTSTVWQFDVKSEDGARWVPKKPIKIGLPVSGPYYAKKIVYFWDGNKSEWRALPSETNFEKNIVWASYPLPFGRFIVRDHPAIYEGKASWYRWKNGPYAAFRFLPKKTKLKVTNISKSPRHGKEITITVNDYGPEEWTGRLIDLDYYAYSRIGLPRGGLMWVRVELLKESKK